MEKKPIVTSQDCPLYIDQIDLSEFKLQGKLGMTLAPGRKSAGLNQIWDRDVDLDLQSLKDKYSTDKLVTLMEEWEFQHLKNENLIPKIKEYNIEHRWFPIVDGSVPTDVDGYILLIDEIIQDLTNGKKVVIHCIAGLGRTGTLAAAILMRLGKSYEEAKQIIRKTRPRTIENSRQENFLENLEPKLNKKK